MISTPRKMRVNQSELTIQRWLSDARRTGQKDTYSGKRRHPRFSWDAYVHVEVIENGQVVNTFSATARDISAGGMGIGCRHKLAAHTLVRITLDETNESLYAKARHCTIGLGPNIVGLEFVLENPPLEALRKSA